MKPLLLHYFLTNRCNAQCVFCEIWHEQPKKDATPDQVLANLEEARAAGCKFVDFTGGEPLLHPELPLFLRKARELKFITSVTTNTILFPRRADELAGLIDLLHFSIDADNAELNDTLHGCRSFDSVMTSVPIALSYNLVPDLLFTYSNDNINAFTGIYHYARDNKLMVILDPVFSLTGNDPVTPATHARAKKYGTYAGVYLNNAHLKLRQFGGNAIQKPLCRAVSSTIVILPDNSLALPCYHHRQVSVPLTVPLSQALVQNQRSYALANQGKYPFCKGCHINCYFDPSYMFLRNSLFFESLAAKAGYAFQKYGLYRRPFP